MTTNAEPRKVRSEGDALADEYRPIGIKCVAAAGEWNRKAEEFLELEPKGEISTMNEEDQAKRFADKTSKATQDAAASATRSAEETARVVEQSYSAAFDNIRNLNVRLIDATQANADALCALERDIATIRTPSDLVTVWMNHAQKQFDMTTKQVSDLTALGQQLATESTTPMTRSFQQAFTQGTT